jgi:hypothetical protein
MGDVKWNIRVIRHRGNGALYLRVDSLMDFRNALGAEGAPAPLLGFVDYIIAQAQIADRLGKEVE